MILQDDKLKPHQIESALHLLRGYAAQGKQTMFDLSGTGSGKTFVAAGVMNALKLPTLVVVPKISISAWRGAAEHFGDSFSVIGYEMLRTGRTPFGKWENMPPRLNIERHWTCTTCQQEVDIKDTRPCPYRPDGIHCIKERKMPWQFGRFIFNPAVKAVVFDEVHRCNGADSLNADMLIGAKDGGQKILGLSATAACGPLHMRAIGYTLGFHTLSKRRDRTGLSFFDWARRYGVRRVPGMGFQWQVGAERQTAIMSEIGRLIVPENGVRVRSEDIVGFPARDISSELYDIEQNGEIDRLYKEMESPLSVLSEREKLDLAPDSPLTKRLRAHQRIELLKVPVAVELARDYLAKGYSVALFVNYAQTMAELRARLKCDCIIDGSTEGVRNRAKNIDDYQENRSPLILVNNQAGGVAVNLQDLDGWHSRMGIVFPHVSAVVMLQVFGRLHRYTGKSKCHYRVIFAANTVEAKMHKALRMKLDNIESLNDDDCRPDNLRLTAFK